MDLQAPIRQRKGPAGGPFSDEKRNQEIIRLFRGGMVTSEIGSRYGIGREAVAKLLRAYKVSRFEGGKSEQARQRKAQRAAAEWSAKLAALDCAPGELTPEQFKPTFRRFSQQRNRAIQRGIGWDLTFGQWWRLWVESGQWAQRGRSHAASAVMARRGDVGPYSQGNVYITTLAKNFVDSHLVRGHRIRGEASLEATLSSCPREPLNTTQQISEAL